MDVVDLVWAKRESFVLEDHILYQIYGYHIVYGPSVLLYIGHTIQDVKDRLQQHSTWTAFEQNITYLFTLVPPEFRNRSLDIESLLIYSHSPAYNSNNITSHCLTSDITIRNYGTKGSLLPMITKSYWDNFYDKQMMGWGSKSII